MRLLGQRSGGEGGRMMDASAASSAPVSVLTLVQSIPQVVHHHGYQFGAGVSKVQQVAVTDRARRYATKAAPTTAVSAADDARLN